jgi:thiosulfate dehydrogenase [quinone] large subunit
MLESATKKPPLKELADMTTTAPRPDVVHDTDHLERDTFLPTAGGYALGAVRIAFGFYFLWAFLDKTFGLGFATPGERAWINGGSPTTGYLSGVEGPLAGFYNALAGNGFIDVLFMLGLLGIGLTLILGMGARVGALSGALMYVFMYGASLPMVTNPVLDDHVTGAMVLVAIALIPASWAYLGLGKLWTRTAPKYLW